MSDELPPLVFSTLTDTAVAKIIADSAPFVFDLFGTFLEPLEAALGFQSSHAAGRMHGIRDANSYERRVQALNFTLNHDDGLSPRDLSPSRPTPGSSKVARWSSTTASTPLRAPTAATGGILQASERM